MSFSLSKKVSVCLPEQAGGYPIDADFKNILWILDGLTDPNKPQAANMMIALRYFFLEEIPENGAEMMCAFIKGDAEDEKEPSDDPAQIDFEFDAQEIYADFLREYGIDLLSEDMHWYRFIALLSGLSEHSSLTAKIQLRTMDLSDCKGKERAKLQKAKERVQIPVRYTLEELMAIEEFEKWGE